MSPDIFIRQRTRPSTAASPAPAAVTDATAVGTAMPVDTRAAGRFASATAAGTRALATDYDIGYGKPPRGRPFAPGQSGNPNGRPRGSKNFHTLLEEALDETVMVRENGREARISKRQVGARRLANKVAEGDVKVLAMLFRSDRGSVATGRSARSDEPVPETDELPPGGAEVIEELMVMVRRAIASEQGTTS